MTNQFSVTYSKKKKHIGIVSGYYFSMNSQITLLVWKYDTPLGTKGLTDILVQFACQGKCQSYGS